MDKIVLCDDDGKDCSLFVEPVNFDAIISTDQDDDVVSDLSQVAYVCFNFFTILALDIVGLTNLGQPRSTKFYI